MRSSNKINSNRALLQLPIIIAKFLGRLIMHNNHSIIIIVIWLMRSIMSSKNCQWNKDKQFRSLNLYRLPRSVSTFQTTWPRTNRKLIINNLWVKLLWLKLLNTKRIPLLWIFKLSVKRPEITKVMQDMDQFSSQDWSNCKTFKLSRELSNRSTRQPNKFNLKLIFTKALPIRSIWQTAHMYRFLRVVNNLLQKKLT